MKRKWKLWMIAFVLFVMTDIMMQSNRAEAKKKNIYGEFQNDTM